jgi:hypothetical protein
VGIVQERGCCKVQDRFVRSYAANTIVTGSSSDIIPAIIFVEALIRLIYSFRSSISTARNQSQQYQTLASKLQDFDFMQRLAVVVARVSRSVVSCLCEVQAQVLLVAFNRANNY